MRRPFFLPFLTAVCCLLSAVGAVAAPPTLEIAPAFGNSFFVSQWQTAIVTAINPDNGETIQGNIQVAIENATTGQREAAFARAIALPKGAGTARIPVTIYFPEVGGIARIHLYLVASPDKGGGVITQRAFDNPPLRRGERTFVLVTQTPDELGLPNGVDLEEKPPASQKVRPPYLSNRPPSAPLRVLYAPDFSALPDRAAGYDAAEAVCLGPDVSPGAFSDAQTTALRGYVTGGGLLLAAGDSVPKLREDERFRPWIPPLGFAGGGDGTRFVGRGRVVSGPPSRASMGGRGASLSSPSSGTSFTPPLMGGRGAGNAPTFWREFLKRKMPPESIGRIAAGSEGYGYDSFSNSVLHVPGLAAPAVVAIAGFLVVYLLLLVPVNYLILKRLDRREWAWLTVPAIAVLFSAGAYGFSYASKGREALVNVASVAEMGAGSGDALVHAAIGIFSPTRASYDVAVDLPDAVMRQPSQGLGGGGAEGVAPLIIEREAGGAVAQGVAVPMWGMNVVSVRTTSVKLGDGVTIKSTRNGPRFSGTITNRTGRTLNNVVIRFADYGKPLGDLAAGKSVSFAFQKVRTNRISQETGFVAYPDYNAAPSPDLTRRQIAADLSRAAYEGFSPQSPLPPLVLTAWTYERLLPVQVDGKSIAQGENVSLVVVTAPKPKYNTQGRTSNAPPRTR